MHTPFNSLFVTPVLCLEPANYGGIRIGLVMQLISSSDELTGSVMEEKMRRLLRMACESCHFKLSDLLPQKEILKLAEVLTMIMMGMMGDDY